jgi:DUF4097 and DUF4098 domain-containing protein YvlB
MSFVNLLHQGVRQISVDNFGSGSVSVEPGSDPDVVEGSINASDSGFLDAIAVRQDRDHLRITLPQRHFGSSAAAHLRLGVPAGLSFNLTTGSADVTIAADIARSRVVSGSGDITLGAATDVTCTTGSGDISIGEVRGEAARVNTGSGDIRIEDAYCPVSAKSGSGDVLIRTVHRAELQASSGSGDISVPSTSGSVDLRSASGSLTIGIADDLAAWLDLNSVSGRIRIALEASPQPAEGEPYVSVRARTASGEIAVYRA